jgi:hypothetical protein
MTQERPLLSRASAKTLFYTHLPKRFGMETGALCGCCEDTASRSKRRKFTRRYKKKVEILHVTFTPPFRALPESCWSNIFAIYLVQSEEGQRYGQRIKILPLAVSIDSCPSESSETCWLAQGIFNDKAPLQVSAKASFIWHDWLGHSVPLSLGVCFAHVLLTIKDYVKRMC